MPDVVTHHAVSIDGRIDGFDVEVGTYYDLAGRLDPDAHLVGSDTLIEGMSGAAPETSPAEVAEPGEIEDATDRAGDDGPLLVVPDSRGRVDDWAAVRAQPFWRRVVVLCSEATPSAQLARLDEQEVAYTVAGEDHVDYARALEWLADHEGVETVLVDSGGTLSGHLFRAGLVDAVSVLVHPVVVGGAGPRSFVRGPDPTGDGSVSCTLESLERLDGDLLWLRYGVDG